MLKGKIFGTSEGASWSEDTLYDRVVGEIQKHCNSLQNACFLETAFEIIGNVVFYAHCSENYCEILPVFVGDFRLPYYLHSELIMGKSRT